MENDNYKPSPASLHSASTNSDTPLQYYPDLLQHGDFGGFWLRVGAHVIDSLILLLPTNTVEIVLSQLLNMYPWAIRLVAIAIVWTPYEILFWQSKWRATPGKRLCGLVIVNANGTAISGADAISRYLAYLFSTTLVVGSFFVAFTERRQALHDLIAKTVVVKRAALIIAARA